MFSVGKQAIHVLLQFIESHRLVDGDRLIRLELRDHRERRLHLVIDLIGDAIGPHLIELAVDLDHLTIEGIESAQTEIAMRL